MNPTHLHLLITHLPIFGTILGAVVLIHGIFAKSHNTQMAAYELLVISAIGAAIAYFTGEAAEESVEHLQGISEAMIEEHEDAAKFAFVLMIISGTSSIVAFILTYRRSPLSRTIANVVLLFSLLSFGIIARTGYLGGKIRHSEVNNSLNTVSGEGEEDDD